MTSPLLIYRIGSLGDTVVALPCFHAIARRFPDRRKIVLTNFPIAASAAPLDSILIGSGLIDDTLAYPLRTRSIAELAALRRKILALGTSEMVYLMPPRGLAVAARDYVFFRLCGMSRIIGLPWRPDLQRNRWDGETRLLERECARLARCIAEIAPIDVADPANWDLNLSEAERAEAARLLQDTALPIVAINMGGKVLENDWGEAKWSQLLGALSLLAPQHALLIVGSAEDKPRAETIGRQWPGTVFTLCGSASPRVSAALLSRARFFVGHDSGPLHLASAVGCPTVGLFTIYRDPGKWYPINGAPHFVQSQGGMELIEIGHVTAKIRSALSAP